jgi:hypothetical protein
MAKAGTTSFHLYETAFDPLQVGTLFVRVFLKPIILSDSLTLIGFLTLLLLQRFWHRHIHSIRQSVLEGT